MCILHMHYTVQVYVTVVDIQRSEPIDRLTTETYCAVLYCTVYNTPPVYWAHVLRPLKHGVKPEAISNFLEAWSFVQTCKFVLEFCESRKTS